MMQDKGDKISDLGVANPEFGGEAVGTQKFFALAQPLAKLAIEQFPSETKKHQFVIADYGCGDGSTSLVFLRQVIGWLKTKFGEERDILICYEDQHSTNYNCLFDWVQGRKSQQSYVNSFKNVFIVASPTGFYSQCFPTGFIDFGISAAALQWLSKIPIKIKNDLYVSYRFSRATDEERDAYQKQAAEDWERFLLLRATELAPGGQLIVVCVANNTKPSSNGHKFICHMRDLWLTFVEEGQITEEEFHDISFPVYMRTPEEIRAPFETEESRVRKAGLRLVHVTDVYDMSIVNRNNNTGENGSTTEADELQAYGVRVASAIRWWSNSTFLNALSKERSEIDKKRIIDDFYSRLASCLTSSLGWNCHEVPIVAVHVEKDGNQ